MQKDKRENRREAFLKRLAEMQDEMPSNELAAKLMGDIDDLHN